MKPFYFSLLAALMVGTTPVLAADTTSTADDRTSLGITIYNENLALVRDGRRIVVDAGMVLLDYEDVSARIRPETALLTGNGLTLIEQNFDFDLLTPEKLLQKAVGGTVRIFRPHPTKPHDVVEEGTVLAANNGAIIQIGDRIEVWRGGTIPGRLVFDTIPENLRARPTLSMKLEAATSGARDVELTYLTGGLGWKADYVGRLNADEDEMSLQGWITLTNRSGSSFSDADVQLVAGDVNQVDDRRRYERRQSDMVMAMAKSPQAAVEAFADYHLYSLPYKTTVADNQTKQVAFIKASMVKVEKSYRIDLGGFMTSEFLNARVFLTIHNEVDSGLGEPLPGGIFRVYQEDSNGNLQFVGEDRTRHTPTGEQVELFTGNAFDVTVTPTLKDRRDIRDGKRLVEYTVTEEVVLKNAKDRPVSIEVRQTVPLRWDVLKENHKSLQEDANTLLWTITVPAKGEALLSYDIRVKQR